MKADSRKKQTILFLLVVVLLAVTAFAAAVYRSKHMGKIVYLEHLDEVAVTVDDVDYRLRDLAFYLAYEEGVVEEQARVYDLENTRAFWNVYTNHSFIRLEARDLAMDMAVHDAVFYQMAKEDGVKLTEEERQYMENQKLDFWNDLEDPKRLGVSLEEIGEVFERMALAQKKQQLLADQNGVDYREYNIEGSVYEALLSEHTYHINEELWERLEFGNITLDPQR